MPRFRTLAVLAVSLVLACSSLAMAEPRGARPVRVEAPETGFLADTLSRLWDWLTAGWTKEGCISDLSGACTGGVGTAQAPLKEGCVIDPSGSPCTGNP